MSVSIIVPVYNALECARDCLASIYSAGATAAFEVIVVNNGSAGNVGEWLGTAQARYPNLRVLNFPEPLGFARAVNEGARAARFERLVLLNSDTLVTPGWLEALSTPLDKDPRIGIVGAVTNNCGHPVQAAPDAKEVAPADAIAHAERIRGRSFVEEPQRLVFFCVLVRRALWERLAGLDESYREGNYEDDDFCLRARLCGYRLAVAREAFVYHHERQTFDGNRLDHGEALARNQALFNSRAARWSKELPPAAPANSAAAEVTVIVPTLAGRIAELRDSLASLANQTVGGFEVLIVSGEDVAAFRGFAGLDTGHVRVAGERGRRIGALLNEGLSVAGSRRVAFLPAGDVFFPFHLEVLLQGMNPQGPDQAAAAYTAWSFLDRGRTGAPRLDEVVPSRLALGDWAPLACWMCADASRAPRFNEELRDWSGWEFSRRLVRESTVRYLPRVTCQKKATGPLDAVELRRVMEAEPAASPSEAAERSQFARAVQSGVWETSHILERSEIERRARRLLQPPRPLVTDPRELDLLAGRLAHAAGAARGAKDRAAGDAAVFLFNIVGWTHLTQRPHHFARGLARLGRRVFWIDVDLQAPELADSATLTRTLEPNLIHVTLPAAKGDCYQIEWSEQILNAMEAAIVYIASAFGVASAVQLVNFPKWLPLVERLRKRFGWPLVYDCLDNQKAFGDLHRNNEAHMEAALVRDAALVIASGRTLLDMMSAGNPNTIFISNGADYDLFANAAGKGLLSHLPKPVAGFFGAFSEWLDLRWIAEAARRFPSWSFVYIGREGFSRPASRRGWEQAVAAPNITVLPQMEPELLAEYTAEFDICTMPFRDLAITRSMNAVKLYEYLSAGKPVVAPDLPEVHWLARQGLVSVYRDWEQSFALLEEGVRGGNGPEQAAARRRFASMNTWNHRVAELEAALGSVIGPAAIKR